MEKLITYMTPLYQKITGKDVQYVGLYQSLGWSAPVKFYKFYCTIHKEYVVNYPMGHGQILKCPLCLRSNQ